MEVDEPVMRITSRVFHGDKMASHTIKLQSAEQLVEELRNVLYNTLDISPEDFTLELVYHGRKLASNTKLASYKVKDGSRINVIVNDLEQVQSPLSVTKLKFMEAVRKIMNPEYAYMTRKILNDAESDTVNTIISQVPGLSSDLVAQGILKDYSMMNLLFEESNLDRIFKNHPSLPPAFVDLSKKVVALADQDTNVYGVPINRTNQYRLDMSEEEDDDEPDQPAPAVHTITANQLAAAIALASGASAQTPTQPTNTPPTNSPPVTAPSGSTQVPPTQNYGSRQIQGISQPSVPTQASDGDSGSQTAAQTYSSQLQQLMTMGITNRTAALQALEAAGGNLDLAIDIIYGGADDS